MLRIAILMAPMLVSCSAASPSEIQDWADELASENAFTAIAAATIKDGEVTHIAAGRMSPDSDDLPDANTTFEIGSITKSFTDLLLAEMVEAGQVSYDTTIRDIIGTEITFANQAIGDITLLQLATHTSGLARMPANFAAVDPMDPYKDFDNAALLAALAMARDKQPLGNHYTYSNLGVGTLGYLLGKVHGEGYVTALTEIVLEPMGMNNTGFTPGVQSATPYRGGQVVSHWSLDAMAGAGALHSSINDLTHAAQILLGNIENPLNHDLEADQEIFAPADGFEVTRVWHVARSSRGPVYWHNGGTGGFFAFLGFRPATSEAVVILVSGDTDPTEFGLTLLAIDDPLPPDGSIDESILGQYEFNGAQGAGIYELDGMLVGQLSGQPPVGLYALGDDWYAIDLADASVRFLREGDQVSAIELVQNGIVQTGSRTADIAQAVARTEVEIPEERLVDFVGEYVINENAKFTIRIGADELEAQLTGQPFFPIFAKGDDVFFYRVVDAELHFERDDEGKIDALVLRQGAIVQRAERSD